MYYVKRMVWSIYKRVRTIHILQRMILEVEGFDKGKQKKVTIKGQTISKVTFHNVTSPQNERKIVTQT